LQARRREGLRSFPIRAVPQDQLTSVRSETARRRRQFLFLQSLQFLELFCCPFPRILLPAIIRWFSFTRSVLIASIRRHLLAPSKNSTCVTHDNLFGLSGSLKWPSWSSAFLTIGADPLQRGGSRTGILFKWSANEVLMVTPSGGLWGKPLLRPVGFPALYAKGHKILRWLNSLRKLAICGHVRLLYLRKNAAEHSNGRMEFGCTRAQFDFQRHG